jgi:RNA polymerase sigma factor (sigma-70 family)
MAYPRGEVHWTPLTPEQEATVARYARVAANYSRSWAKSWPYDRDECESRAYMALMKASRTCPPDRTFASWLGACVRNQICRWRQGQRSSFRFHTGYDVDDVPPEIPSIDDVTSRDDRAESIVEARDLKDRLYRDLTPRERAVADGLIRGLSYSDIGRSLGVTAPRIHVNVQSVRRKAREILAP